MVGTSAKALCAHMKYNVDKDAIIRSSKACQSSMVRKLDTWVSSGERYDVAYSNEDIRTRNSPSFRVSTAKWHPCLVKGNGSRNAMVAGNNDMGMSSGCLLEGRDDAGDRWRIIPGC